MSDIRVNLSEFDNTIKSIGERKIISPNKVRNYVSDGYSELYITDLKKVKEILDSGKLPPTFEKAGSREKIYYKPEGLKAGIVTCGGLCPGLNDVIRAIVMSLYYQYNVTNVIGFRFGYNGLADNPPEPPRKLIPDDVADIHYLGGTILGTSRGAPSVETIVNHLEKENLNIFFTIGGDGTLRGAHEIALECLKRKNGISVIGIPKTIDNDIDYISRTFGFMTAVEEARKTITAIHNEVFSLADGVGIVKLMGRDSGYIAANACLSNNNANICLIPEVDFDLYGEKGLLTFIKNRIQERHHIVIVVAEGAGQNYFDHNKNEIDASGNLQYDDIGIFLSNEIKKYSIKEKFPMTVKYIDPSYQLRSREANAGDSSFCLALGQHAVHAAMAGKTDMIISLWNNCFIHVPIELAVSSRKRLNPNGKLWQLVNASTGQPSLLN